MSMSIDIIFVFYWIAHSYHFFICKSRLRGAWYWEQDADEIRQGCIKADIEQGCNYRLPPYLPPKHKKFGEHQQEGHRGKYNGIDAFVVVNIWHFRMGYWTPRDNKCPAKSSTLCNTWHLYRVVLIVEHLLLMVITKDKITEIFRIIDDFRQ